MIYELRTYTTSSGTAERLHTRFEEHTLPIFERIGIEVVGFFTDEENPNRFVYLTRFEDNRAREAAWEAFGADPEWRQVKASSEAEGPLVTAKSSTVLRPTVYSPMR